MDTIGTKPTSNEQLKVLRDKGWRTQKHFSQAYGMTSHELGAWLKSKGWKTTKNTISDDARDNNFAVNGYEGKYGLNPLWNVKKIHPYLEQEGYLRLIDKQEVQITRKILTFIGSWNNRAGRAVIRNDLCVSDIQTFQDIEYITFESIYNPFTLHEKFDTKQELKACIDTFDELLSQRPGLLSHLGHRDILDQYIALCRKASNAK